jgi:hypothetical protein
MGPIDHGVALPAPPPQQPQVDFEEPPFEQEVQNPVHYSEPDLAPPKVHHAVLSQIPRATAFF